LRFVETRTGICSFPHINRLHNPGHGDSHRRPRARDARELTGATFTVSNLGMYGMTAITAPINPPQAEILAAGAARPTLARADDGEIVDRQLLTLTLSCDHRILNGADGSRFPYETKEILENPLRLAL
jgi:pyruvate dehydrogenase E2 component (dihydrolipoamide acetyltransferase)